MTRAKKVHAVKELCDSVEEGCYACNFLSVCREVKDMEDIPDKALDEMLNNRNKVGAGAVMLPEQADFIPKLIRKEIEE